MKLHLSKPALRLGLCLLLLLTVSCSPPSAHILFIGNSYTYINGGIDKQLKGLEPTLAVKTVAVAGYTLEDHWKGDALGEVRKGGWAYVILQEQSQRPVTDKAQFFTYARDFDVEVRAAGAQTILLMTWERPDSVQYGVTTANLAAAYTEVGRELGVKVAPAGLAFARSLQERPDLTLYSQDGHPTIYGTYLAACVIEMTIFGNTHGNPYAGKGISDDIRDFLQGVAARTLGY